MSKSHTKEVLKRLRLELDATTDTKEIIRIGNTIAKLTPRPKRAKRKPKPVEKPNKTSALVAKWADRLSHLPFERRILFSVINEYEQRQCEGTEAERLALMGELLGSLSMEERAAIEALSAS